MAAQDCIFCKIVAGELPSKKEYEDEDVIVFHDIHPSAPFHVLIIPREHISGFTEIKNLDLWKKMAEVARKLIEKHGLRDKGYRLVNNGGEAALIDHLHMHLMGGVSKERKV